MGDYPRSSADSRESEEAGSVEGGGVRGGGENGVVRCSSGSQSVDRALVQHLIHCESLLVVSVFSRRPFTLPYFLCREFLPSLIKSLPSLGNFLVSVLSG